MDIRIPMEVLITDGEQRFSELDFYHGSKALEGTSEAIAVLSNAILNREIVRKVPSIEGINAIFRNSYEGSFGQRFELKIVGPRQKENFQRIGERAFFEVLRFYLTRPLMNDFEFEMLKSRRVVEELNELYTPIMKRLYNPFLKLHKPVEEQHYSVILKRARTQIVCYDRVSLENLTREQVDDVRMIIHASITRFNRLTGTGRMILDEDSESVSFEPAIPWRDFPLSQKKTLSRNLDANNQVDNFTTLTLEVSAVRNYLGDVKKYCLHQVIMG